MEYFIGASGGPFADLESIDGTPTSGITPHEQWFFSFLFKGKTVLIDSSNVQTMTLCP